MNKSKSNKTLAVAGSIIFVVIFCLVGFIFFIKAMDGKEIKRGEYVISVSSSGRYASVIRYNGDDEKVVIPKRVFFLPVVAISDSAFENNKSLKTVVFPTTVRTIRAKAFSNCTALEKVEFKGEIFWIYDHAFFNCCSIKELNIPYSRDLRVGESAFESCSSLESVDFNYGNVGLETYAFYDCEKLETLKGVGDGVSAAEDAFDNTAFLNNYEGDFFIVGTWLVKYLGDDTDVIIPENVTGISSTAFADKNITSIHMPSDISYFALYFNRDYRDLENKVKIYFGKVDEFDVFSFAYVKKNIILIAPQESAVIDYARRNGISYLAE